MDSVNKFAVYKITNFELDFKSQLLFSTCSVATHLVTSLGFIPYRSAIMLCHFGQTRNGSVATHSNLLSSTATSSAAGGYVVLESFGQNEEPASRKEERTEEKLTFVPRKEFLDAVRWHVNFWHVILIFLLLFF